MESNDELKEIDNKNHTCYYFNDIIKDRDFDFDNISLDRKSYKKSYENILIYGISYKHFMRANLLCIRLDKVDGIIKVYVETKFLVLFGPERFMTG